MAAENGAAGEEAKRLLLSLLRAAVGAADPAVLVPRHLPPRPDKLLVVGAGKAASQMAAAVEAAYGEPLDGFVITRYGHAAPTRRVEVAEAGHPVPDEAGLRATQTLLRRVAGSSEDTFILALISGGGSALLCAPAAGVSFAEKQILNRDLLASGATIAEINTVRKAVSAVKGGGLAEAVRPRPSLTLVLSDVPGDDPALVASGPMSPPRPRAADALAILARYGVRPPAALLSRAGRAERERAPAVPAPRTVLIGSPALSLEAARDAAGKAGLAVVTLSDEIEGEASVVGRVHAAIARSVLAGVGPAAAPCLILSGGETSVTLRAANGRGGRNGEFLLGFLAQLGAAGRVYALACDTDGIDGSQNNAGAIVTPSSLARAAAIGLTPADALARNDSYGFFERLGDLVVTGPTGTNVNDFRAVLVLPAG